MLTEFEHIYKIYGNKFKSIHDQILKVNPDSDYIRGHSARLAISECILDNLGELGKTLEIGFSDVLHRFSYQKSSRWDITNYDDSNLKVRDIKLNGIGSSDFPSKEFSLNLEQSPLNTFESKWNTVLLFEVLEHMEIDPMFLLESINNVLPINGKLIISTPNSASTRIFYKCLVGDHPSFYMKYSGLLYRHNFEYTSSILEDLLKAAGFNIDNIFTIDAFENPLPIASKILNSIEISNKNNRGDNIFAVCTKKTDVVDRFPKTLYDK